MASRLRRDPDLVVLWRGADLLIRNLRTGTSVRASPGAVALLDAFSRPGSGLDVVRTADDRKGMLAAVRELERHRLLVAAGDRPGPDRMAAWNDNVASALYHAATRDRRYIDNHRDELAFLRERWREAGPPLAFKHYSGKPRIPLGPLVTPPATTTDLQTVLGLRRTTRDFSRRRIPLEVVAAIIRGTWAQTGWLGAGADRSPSRTSPSAGALHPLECYVFAHRVERLPAGLYHYDVRGNELRRLKAGDFRQEAVRLASGQRWAGRCAFFCVMTAAFERTLWKYRSETAYRVLWMEAGHFAQTFSLLATSYGLGPFTTAAMQDTRIERFLKLDGIREFPVYLCGAGVPGPLRVSPRWTPIRRPARSITASAPATRSPSSPRRLSP